MSTRTAARVCLLLFCVTRIPIIAAAPEPPTAAIASGINALGLDLYREQIKSVKNTGILLSPYSLSTALAMTYMGADGITRTEMQKVLHLPALSTECGAAFNALSAQLAEVVGSSETEAARLRAVGANPTPIQFNLANRIFVQQGYDLRPTFVEDLRRYFGSDLAQLDFLRNPAHARQAINRWVALQTNHRIRDLLPPGQPKRETGLALVNALYLRAGWMHEFKKSDTQSKPFHLIGAKATPVPTMRGRHTYGYAKHEGYTVVALPYITGQLQLVLLVPDEADGLSSLERSLTENALTDCARLTDREVILHLPKFKLAPETMSLGKHLQTLGLRTAFDIPRGSANFDRMARRRPDDYLFIGEVFHKTWLVLDEHGTEAAAATAVLMFRSVGMPYEKPAPVEVHVDRPFMFAIQHVPSGACLFLGRVTDPH